MKRLTYFLLFISSVCSAQQQITFSQYMFHGLVINPAYAASDEALNATFLHRKQWSNIKGAPQIQSVIAHKYLKERKVGLGATLENVSFGVTKTISFNGIYAYKIKIRKDAGLALGLRVGVSTYRQELTNLNLPAGINDGSFDHDVSRTLFNSGFGAYYEAKKYYAGLTVSGLVNNKLDQGDVSTAHQVAHYFLAGGYLFDINRNLKVKTQALIRAASGSPISTDINVAALLNNIVWVGVTYKYNNSVNGLVEFKLNEQFKVGFAYDIASSDIARVATGAYEMSLNYRYLKKRQHRVMSPRYF